MKWLFLAPLIYGVWKIVAAGSVLLIHKHDPPDKILLLPNAGEPYNPLVGSVQALRALARATRRRWIVLTAYSTLVLIGVFPSIPLAIAGFVLWYIGLKLWR